MAESFENWPSPVLVRSQQASVDCRRSYKIQLYDAAWQTEADRSIDQTAQVTAGLAGVTKNLPLRRFDELVSVPRYSDIYMDAAAIRPADSVRC